jgi:dephospho-CoA kinase
LALADDVIENNGSLQELNKKITRIHKKYMHTCIVSE